MGQMLTVPVRAAFGAIASRVEWAAQAERQSRAVRLCRRLCRQSCPECSERRLVRSGEKAAPVRAGVVNELPLIVVILLIKYPNAFFLAGAGYSNHGAAAESLRAGGRGSRTRRSFKSPNYEIPQLLNFSAAPPCKAETAGQPHCTNRRCLS